MSLVKGENMAGLIYVNAFWKPFICSRSISLTTATEFVDISTKGTGNWKTSKPSRISWTARGDGITSLNSTDLTLADLRIKQFAGEMILLRWQRIAQDGTVYTDQGYAFIENVEDTGAFDNVATFSVSFTGNGPITPVYTPAATNLGKMKRLEYIGIGGELYFENTLLRDKDIQLVTKGGVDRATLILVGTPDPVTLQALYQPNLSSKGRLTFAQAFEPNEIAVVLYQDL